MRALGHEVALAVIKRSPAVLQSPPDTISGALEVLTELLGHEGALAVVNSSVSVLTSPPGTIRPAIEVLTKLLGTSGARGCTGGDQAKP